MSRVFHYTVGPKLAAIAASGALRSMDTQLLPREKPVLWFSSNENWEPTATKPLLIRTSSGMGLYRPELVELHLRFGLYRFALPAKDKRLFAWPHIAIAARIPAEMRLHLIDAGRDVGADPADWFGSLVPVPTADLTFEVFDGVTWRASDFSTGARVAATKFAHVVQHAIAVRAM